MDDHRCFLLFYFVVLLALETQIAFTYVHKWGKWSPVSRSCNRACVKPFGPKTLRRSCLQCGENKQCRRSSTNLCRGARSKVGTCYVGTQCHGPGPYTGAWSAWTTKVACPKRNCNQNKKQVLVRKCQPSSKSSAAFKCPVMKGVGGVRRQSCRCSSDGKQSGLTSDRKYGRWEEWGQWTCHAPCKNDKTTATRKRKCTNYMAGFYCKPDGNNLRETQKAPCRDKTEIRCKMTWGPWSLWSHCTTTCGEATRTRKRPCNGFGEKCKGKSKEYDPCPIDRNCPLIDGKWGGWGRWELKCSVTCGYGVRKRTRLCNNPAPSGGGRTCEGPTEITEPCHVNVVCPVHGAWSAWSDWVCDATCNGTTGRRDRQCDDPVPLFGGLYCSGPRDDYMAGCNNFSCPTVPPPPLLSASLLSSLSHQLRTAHHDYRRATGESVVLSCQNNITDIFIKRFPDSTMRWLKNGKAFLMEAMRMTYTSQNLLVSGLTSNDTGTYMCQIEYAPGLAKTMAIFAVSVTTSKPIVILRENDDMEIKCNGLSFSMLFPEIQETWFHNGSVRFEFGEVPAAVVDTHRLRYVSRSDSGEWLCQVRDPSTDRAWTTNWLRVYVGPPLTFWQKYFTPMHIVKAAVVAAVVIAIAIGVCVYRAKQLDKKSKEHVEKMMPLLTKDKGTGKEPPLHDKPRRQSRASKRRPHQHSTA